VTPTPTITPVLSWTPTSTITPTLTQSLTATITPTPTTTPTSIEVTPPAVSPGRVVTYPSPAKGDVLWFLYSAEAAGRIEVRIFNVAGEQVALLEDESPAAGLRRIPWDIRDLAPGVYLYRLTQLGPLVHREYDLQRLVVVK